MGLCQQGGCSLECNHVVEAGTFRMLGVFGNVIVRRINLDYHGQTLPQHTHNYDHVVFVGKGRVKIRVMSPVDGSEEMREVLAPDWVEVPAKAKHQMQALEDGCVCFCVFAVRDADGQVPGAITEEHRKLVPRSSS